MRAGLKRSMNTAFAVVLSLLCAVSLLGAPGTALARGESEANETNGTEGTSLSIAGVDFMEPTAEGWELLRAENGAGATVYLDLSKNGTPLFQRQAYAIPAAGAEGANAPDYVGEGQEISHIIGLQMGQKDAASPMTVADAFGTMPTPGTYALTVHDAAREGRVLYEGTVYPVFARLVKADGTESYQLMGTRVEGKTRVGDQLVPETHRANVGAGALYYTNVAEGAERVTYQLVRAQNGSDAVLDDATGAYVVTYEQVPSGALSGAINYVDTEGVIVRTDSVSVAPQGETIATFEKSFFEDGKYYRVIASLTGTTVVLTPTSATKVVRVVEVAGAAANAYEVTINYVDQDGKQLWSDDVVVKGRGYQYTLPDTFSMKKASGINYYTLDRVQADRPTADIEPQSAERAAAANPWNATKPVIKLDGNIADQAYAGAFGEEGGKRVLTAVYQDHEADKTVALTVVEVDGSTGTELGRQKITVTPDSTKEEVTYTPANKVIDGVTYVPWSGAKPITYLWENLQEGVDLLQYVYYVPEDYVPGDAYDITVQYLNIANSQVLKTQTITIDPEMTDYVEILGEERFILDGNEYVRLNGQETAIRHAYFTPTRTYTIYYRDVNDELNANVTVQRVQIIDTERVVTVPGTTVITAAPTTTVVAEGEGAPATAVDLGVGAGDGTAVIGDEATPLATMEGQTTGDERVIEDNENPLSAGAEPGSEFGVNTLAGIALSAAALAALGAALFLWLRWRKKKPADESTEA